VPEPSLRSDAGIGIGPGVAVDGDLRIVEVAGGRVAVLHHKGPYAELHKAYRWLYRDWLPKSGEQCADRPCFEEYLNNPRTLPPEEWLTDICLPLAER
jgi:AraC family transcriptional regulator